MAELEKREERGLGTVEVSSTDVFHGALVAGCVTDAHGICESSSLKVSACRSGGRKQSKGCK